MNIYAIDQRTSDHFNASNDDDLLINPVSQERAAIVINGLAGVDTLQFPGDRDSYRDISITMDEYGVTHVTGTEAGGYFFGFASQFKYFDITLLNFESIRFTQADGMLDIIDISPQSVEHFGQIKTGSWSRDQFSGSDKHDSFDGALGLDIVSYARSRSEFTLSASASGYQLSRGDNDVDILKNIERLQFSDMNLAIDLTPDGNPAKVAKILAAVFGASAILNKDYVAIGLKLMEDGKSYNELAAIAINAAGLNSRESIVDQLWFNLMGTLPNAEQAQPYVDMLAPDLSNTGNLGVIAADYAAICGAVDLGTLTRTGLEYSS